MRNHRRNRTKPRHQRHDSDRRDDDEQKRDHAQRNAENQKGQCSKHGRHHNDCDRSGDPRTPSAIALDHDHGEDDLPL
jgi:hypothetical protein